MYVLAHLLLQFLLAPVRGFDVTVKQQVLLSGQVIEVDIILHAHPQLFTHSLCRHLHVFPVHLDRSRGGGKQPSQEGPATMLEFW